MAAVEQRKHLVMPQKTVVMQLAQQPLHGHAIVLIDCKIQVGLEVFSSGGELRVHKVIINLVQQAIDVLLLLGYCHG